MTLINPRLFRMCDIRGCAEGDKTTLTPDAARLVGQAFGTYLWQMSIERVVVGCDNRRSSEALAGALIDGLQAAGAHVVDIGLVATPVLYWYAVNLGGIGGVMVTGSHLTPEMNGFKPCIGNRSLCDDDLQALRTLIETDNLHSGNGSVEINADSHTAYVADIVPRLSMRRSLKVVVDGGNGTGGLFAPRLFSAWGHHVTPLFCEPDGDFPNHHPDPHRPETLETLVRTVRDSDADLGIAYDGDADRLGVVDENGERIAGDRLLALLARDMLYRNPGAAVVADVLCSQVLFDEIAQHGGFPVMWKTGHGLIKAKMKETGALLGGELTGHIFPNENYFGFDDPFIAAGRLLQFLGESEMPLSALDASMPRLYCTPEYRPHCPDNEKQTVLQGMKDALAGAGKLSEIDGVRVQFERGWGLIRASNTEPTLSLRFEGETEADAAAYRDLFFAALGKFPQVESVSKE